jgi:hypothetical protein
MGSTGNELAKFSFLETTNIEDIRITDLYIFDQVAATTTVLSAFGNLKLYQGSTLLSEAGSASEYTTSTLPGYGYYYRFNSFVNPLIVPKSGSVQVVLKGDVSSYSASGATDNTTHVFKIATSTVTAFDTTAEAVLAMGSTSNVAATVTLSSPNANAQTVLRSKLTITGTALGTTSGRVKTATDDLATINFTADAAGSIKLQSLTVTVGGSAPSGTQFFTTSGTPIKLYDTIANASYNPTATSTTSVSFDLLNYVVNAGQTKSFTLRLNTLSPYTAAASNGIAQGLSASVNAATDVTYTTGESGGTTGVSIPSTAAPVQINSVSYSAGT